MGITELLGDDPHLKAAFCLITTYEAAQKEKPNTKARAVAQAKFDGMCTILDRLRMAPTDFAVQMSVIDALRNAPDRPQFHFGSKNEEHNEWMAARCRAIAVELGWLQAAV